MHYLVFLVDQDIPERGEFFSGYSLDNPYEQLMFVRVKDEQEIRLHLCNWEVEYDHVYFVLKDDVAYVKSKRLAFRRKIKMDDGLEFIGAYIGELSIAHTDDESIMATNGLPECDRPKEIFRVYNQKEENKLRLTYVDYVTADDESDAYMKELDQNHIDDGTFIYTKDNEAYLKSIAKTKDWRMKVKWGSAVLERIIKSPFFFDEATYDGLKAD
ncbi:BA75_00713T0 [Komagataella pastoris]|uniref:BA75_00713T0 n=1 Tax=Komagataella pastoris TaxID=4922 RepID=A0A1B2J9N2_PICPA|nr:BA75_00713T0 [Komagataella pastoris]